MSNKLDNQQMFSDNEKLIYYVLKKYFPHIYNNFNVRNDYYQIGAIGLIKAIKRYDSNVSKFSTYAVPMIWGEIKRNIRDYSNIIHYSRRIIDIANNLMTNFNEIERSEEDFITWIESKLNELDISVHDKNGVINYLSTPIALDSQYGDDDDDRTYINKLTSNLNVTDDIEYNDYVNNICKRLNDRDKHIFTLLLRDMTQVEIANKLNISQAQVSRIQRKIKMYVIKELYDSGQYDLAINKIYDLYALNKNIEDINIVKICQDYQINLNKCPKSILEKRMKSMTSDDVKTYSRKVRQKLILKCTIKSLLMNKQLTSNDDFKKCIEKLLIKNNYNNESIIHHLYDMTDSQIKSCIDLAKKSIEKFQYSKHYEIIIDETDFKVSKFIKTDIFKSNQYHTLSNKPKSLFDNSIVDSIISLLEQFKKDNLIVKF